MIHPQTYAGLEAPRVGVSASAYCLDWLIEKASVIFEVEKEQIMSESRKREHAEARQAVMYVARERLNNTFQFIAKHFGKDHSTVIASCKKVKNLTKVDEDYNRKVTALSSVLWEA
jgi:chromosomal replication initiator protein